MNIARIGTVLVAVTGLAVAQPTKEVHKTLPLDPNGLVSIDNYKGTIRVSAWDRNEVQVDVQIEEDNSWIAQDIRNADVRIRERAAEVTLKSEWDRVGALFGLGGASPLFHYTVKVPRGARLRIKDYKSETSVDGVTGAVDLDTYKGSVRLRDLAGALTVNTYKGEIRASFAAFTARSSIETYKGDIDLEMPRSARFNLRADLDRKADLDSDFVQMARARRGDHFITSPVNGGGPELRLKSHKGSFRLHER